MILPAIARSMLVAALFAAAPTVTPALARAETKLQQSQSGYHRFTIGDIRVTALSDGTVPLDTKVLTNVSRRTVETLLAKAFVASPVDASVNAYLIELGDRLVLVDTGAGELYGPGLKKLPAVLQAIGHPPDQITDILVTHIHTDHTGGLMDGERRVFPAAALHVEQRELDFWLTPSNIERVPAPLKRLFREAELKVRPYVDAGQVQTFDGATQLFPGIRAVPSPGHTAGHTFYSLESKGQTLMFWGDILHVAEVQLPQPTVTIEFDSDPVAAAAQRARVFADAARRGYLVAPAHIAFPGVGHLVRDTAGYRWIPLPYVNDAVPAGTPEAK